MENMTGKDLQQLNNFIEACDGVINGKYILADVKLKNLVQSINESDYVYKIINNAMINFNFEKELQRAEVQEEYISNEFLLPEDRDTMIALVYCLLVCFDSKRIDFYEFIKKNFQTLAINGEYNNFANRLIVPFKEAIVNYYKQEQEQEQQNYIENNYVDPKVYASLEDEPEQDDAFEKLSKSIDAIIEKVYVERRIREQEKQDLLYVLKSTEYALKYQDMRLISAFITCFNTMARKIKSIQFLLEDVKNIIKEYYEQN